MKKIFVYIMCLLNLRHVLHYLTNRTKIKRSKKKVAVPRDWRDDVLNEG